MDEIGELNGSVCLAWLIQQRFEHRIAFANTLIETRWPGVEQFLLPHIIQSVTVPRQVLTHNVLTNRLVVPSLESKPFDTLDVLNKLAENGYLERGLANVQAGRWRPVLLLGLRSRLEKLTITAEPDYEETIRLLRLVARFPQEAPDFKADLRQAFTNHMQSRPNAISAKSEWLASGPFNACACLAQILRSIRELGLLYQSTDHEGETVVSRAELRDLIENYYWHRNVLEEIAEILESSPPEALG